MNESSTEKVAPPEGRAVPLDPDAHRQAEASDEEPPELAQRLAGKEK